MLAVKPQQMRAALAPLAGGLGRTLVISVAAGIRVRDLARWLGGHSRIVRCMPNTPALIGAGITGLYAPAGVSAAERRRAERILGAVGETVWVKHEAQLDPVTAVSAAGRPTSSSSSSSSPQRASRSALRQRSRASSRCRRRSAPRSSPRRARTRRRCCASA